MTLTVTLALVAAAFFAVASVLQHRGARRVRQRAPLHPGLFAELARSRGWLVGITAQAAGVVLHLLAVNFGPLSVVQPVLTVGLVMALVLQRILGRRIGKPSWLAAGLVVLGLSIFLAVTPPSPAGAPVAMAAWAPGLLLSATVVAIGLGAALLTGGTVRCVCFGASAGVLMATSAALGKAWGTMLQTGGLVGLLNSWQLWAALACGAGGMMLSQAAFQAGPLGGSLAAMMAIDPVIGVALGVIVFVEPFATPGTAALRVLGLGLTIGGVWLLASAQRPSGVGSTEMPVARSRLS
ncbi:MAG TPA: DMT family transporter [Pseudonocardia sp.]|jgi:hypothetical protein|nr:DMT family transporter [Pseudonocardia sp.]